MFIGKIETVCLPGLGAGSLALALGVVVEGDEEQLCEADGPGHSGRRRTSPLQEERSDQWSLTTAGGGWGRTDSFRARVD